MRKTEYLTYTHKELLDDDFFISSHLYPTEESIAFWNQLKNEDPVFARELDDAVGLLRTIPFRNGQLTQQATETLFSRIQRTIERKRRKKKILFYATSAAAACITVVLLLNYFLTGFSDDMFLTGIDTVEKPILATTKIQLIDNNNNELVIDSEDPVITHDEQGILSVNSQKVGNTASIVEETQEIQYNQLIIPPGKRSYLTLSDGTQIWVNANSRVVYPNVFDKKRREILIEGEAFLEVAPKNDWPFYVRTRDLQVKVVGTSFNVSAYEDDPEQSIVLVTGKVRVNTKDKQSRTLSPHEMLSFAGGEISTRIVDVDNYISWRKGTYTFNSEKFSLILKRLSKYYNIDIKWTKEVDTLYCSGSLNLKDDIFDLLDKLQATVPVSYRKNEDKIEIYVKP